MGVHASHLLQRGAGEHRPLAAALTRFCLKSGLIQLCDTLTYRSQQSAKQTLLIFRATTNFNDGEHAGEIFDVGGFVVNVIQSSPSLSSGS